MLPARNDCTAASLANIALRSSSVEQIGQRPARLDEVERNGVQAMPFPGRPRPVRKHVAEVAAATRADFFDPNHRVPGVGDAPDVGFVVGLEEARPAGTGIEFRTRAKQGQSAETAHINAVLLVVKEDAAECRFGAMLQQNVAFLAIEAGGQFETLRVGGRIQTESAHNGY